MVKLLGLAAVFVAVFLTACSGDPESSPAPTSTTAAETPAAAATATVTATREATATATLPATATATEAPATSTPVPPTATPQPPTRPAQPVYQPTQAPAPPSSSTVLNVSAQGLAFSVQSFSATSGSTVTVVFTNNDNGVLHDFSINNVIERPSCTGPCTDSYSFTAPAPGTYKFLCSVHTYMAGAFTVTP